MPYGPTNFWSTAVKPYFQDEFSDPPYTHLPDSDQEASQDRLGKHLDDDYQPEGEPEEQPRRRGRPKGSRNKLKAMFDHHS
jgi:hypothetical protein